MDYRQKSVIEVQDLARKAHFDVINQRHTEQNHPTYERGIGANRLLRPCRKNRVNW